MRAQRNALLLVAAVAALSVVSAGRADAQSSFSHGGLMNSHIGKPPMPTHPMPTDPMPSPPTHGGGHHGGWHPGGGWHGPGIVVVAPPPRQVIVEDPDEDVPRRTKHPRRTRQRTTVTQRSQSGVPPAGETRYIPDEVVIEVANSVSDAQIDALQNRFRLTRIDSYRFDLAGTILMHWRIPDSRTVPEVIRALEGDAVVASAQPNYLFALQQSDGNAAQSGPSQYELAKLRLPEAHAIAKGDNILVAVIDTAVDTRSPELAGSIAGTVDTLSTPMKPHKHGTSIAGLIAAHGRLMGAAPDAKILAVRAFDPAGDAGGEGTTFNILKGIDWAAKDGARVINMSFAGPPDPAIHRSIVAAHKKGIVLVAAAGNAGAKSPPLYPAADPDVIAVTATTVDDKLFEPSNRGRHIDVAAPGDQILVAIPDGGYEVSSGTSYSAAEVSGIVALMLQHAPHLSPDKVRQILLATAQDLGPRGRDSLFGAGLVDAYRALGGQNAPVAQARPIERVSTGQR
jgi:subtilisin family serine protease